MDPTSAVAGVKRNFILQQGLEEPRAASCSTQYSSLLFQPRLVGLVVLVAVILKLTVKEPPRGYTDPPGVVRRTTARFSDAMGEILDETVASGERHLMAAE